MPDVRQLRSLLSIAEHGGFSRAALATNISQAALSETIRKLERELGVELLERSSRGAKPTAAGESLIEDARDVIARFDAAIERARRTASGEAGMLRLGFEATGAGALMTRARARFATRHPQVRVEPKRYDWAGEVPALRDGACDVAFVWLPADTGGLALEIVAREDRYVGRHVEHALAAQDAVSIMDLLDEPTPYTSRAPRFWRDWWAVNPRPDGSEPIWARDNDNVEEMLEQVSDGSSVAIVPESMTRYYARPDIAWRRIADVDPLRVAIAWRVHERAPLVHAFVALVRELASEQDGATG